MFRNTSRRVLPFNLVLATALLGGPFSKAEVTQQAYIKASNTGVDDAFGYSVAVSANTLVVGAPGEGSNATGVNGNQTNNSMAESGAVYVFSRSGGGWTQQAYLKASNTGAQDQFGWAVAVSGDTLVVGSPFEASSAAGVNGNQLNNSAPAAGAVYVFVRNGTAWTQQAYLKAGTSRTADQFGYAVGLSGDTLVVGAFGESSNATGVNGNQANHGTADSGAAYVFVRNGTTWTQQAYLKASNTGAQDGFGGVVAIAADTVVVGAAGEGSNATGVNGNAADNSALNAGAAYVFTRLGTAWTQQAYLKASNTGAGDGFGSAVAISGDSVMVGAPGEASNATGVNGNQSNNSAAFAGAAYLFTRNGTAWTQQAYLKAGNAGAQDRFGGAVGLSGGSAVAGAVGEASNATGLDGNQANDSATFAGAAYLFTRTGTTWTQQAYLKASNTEGGDAFGGLVALSGDTVAVTATGEWSNATGVNGNQANNGARSAGAAYIFTGVGVTAAPSIRLGNVMRTAQDFVIEFFSDPGLTGWVIMGSATLQSWPDTLTGASVITEATPGTYRAVVSLASKPSSAYFLRIGR